MVSSKSGKFDHGTTSSTNNAIRCQGTCTPALDPLSPNLDFRDDGGAMTLVVQTLHAETHWTRQCAHHHCAGSMPCRHGWRDHGPLAALSVSSRHVDAKFRS